ncbi:MAG: hypothetical protein K6A32_09165 [Bacteroidales bacterium]|nr:hypothetical protein [Bacteroidales bacterium]
MNNDFENRFDDPQLEDMRQQMAMLKQKLEQQEIVNDQLIRESLQSKLRSVRIQKWGKMFFIFLAMLYVPAMLYWLLHTEMWFCLLSMAFFAIAAIYDFYYMNGISEKSISRNQLLETGRLVARMKQMNARWLWFSIPFLIFWLATLIMQVINSGDLSSGNLQGFLYGCASGLIIGGTLGTIIYFRQQRRAQEIIDQIENITSA